MDGCLFGTGADMGAASRIEGLSEKVSIGLSVGHSQPLSGSELPTP